MKPDRGDICFASGIIAGFAWRFEERGNTHAANRLLDVAAWMLEEAKKIEVKK